MTAEEKLAAIRALHSPTDGEWNCERPTCKLCVDGDAHQGSVCSYCTDNDSDYGWMVQWPCPTVQLIDEVPAPGLRGVK